MRKSWLNRRRRDLLTGLVLAVILLRAYVPVGFMPASGKPFLVELCPAAASMPMSMPMSMSMSMSMPMPMSGHHHGGSADQFQHCPFGSVPAAGPVSHGIVFAPPAHIGSTPPTPFESVRLGAQRDSAHRPRGPPASA